MHPELPKKIKLWNAGLRDCPLCKIPMTILHVDGLGARRRMSKDHILPRAWGGGRLGLIAVNIRWICQQCNQHLAACGHCIGALACIQQVAAESCVSFSNVYKSWRMGVVSSRIVSPKKGRVVNVDAG